MPKSIQLVECPRDAMQGWKRMIPTAEKVNYINSLLKVGFDILDFGSFVSAKAIPQMADTKDVIPKLDLTNSPTKLLAIIANLKGAEEASLFNEIAYLGYPFSISETFQKRNTNKTIEESIRLVESIQNICNKQHKTLLIYISMGFGNPYGDPYNADVVWEWVNRLHKLDIKNFSIADTVGVAQPETIKYIFDRLVPEFEGVFIGAHFHSSPEKWKEKIEAAFNSGCTRFDSAIKGIGGCPMAEDELVGNIATENIVNWCDENNIELKINRNAFFEAEQIAGSIFI